MAAPTYATPEDLATWVGLTADEPFDGATAALRSACRAVREATITWRYHPDPVTGLPVDTDLAGVLRDATCIQAAALLALDVDPQAGGTVDATVETSAGIGSARVTLAGAEQAAAARAKTITGLCPEAAAELRLAHVFKAVWAVG